MKKKSLEHNNALNSYVANNFKNVSLNTLLFPILLLMLIGAFLFVKESFSVEGYTQIQKNLFLTLNHKFEKFKNLQFNLTQLGDVVILLPFFTIFIVYASKFWQSLLTSLVFSITISTILKKIFSIPRPASVFDNNTFIIVGERLSGNTSLPSGHSIAVFTIITLIFYAFQPKTIKFKILWAFFIFILGLIIVFTRIGVGAHYPLDVITGSIIGYITAVLGVFFNTKYAAWSFIENKNYYPIFIAFLSIWAIALISKIMHVNLIIFYFSLFPIMITLFLIIRIYAQK